MNRTIVTFLGAAMLASSGAYAGDQGNKHQSRWGYTGETGPAYWGRLDPKFALCGVGRNQSPIDISDAVEVETDLPEIGFSYDAAPLKIINNGHTLQVNYAPGSHIEIDGATFKLLQLHFHSPSENRVDGKLAAMEVHFVHKDGDGDGDGDGNLAVVAVLLKEGAANPLMDLIWNNLPEELHHEKQVAGVWFNGSDLLPQNRDYVRFTGSLTTPPCSEGVRWLVMKEPMEVSDRQVDQFLSIVGRNARPVQNIYARRVMK